MELYNKIKHTNLLTTLMGVAVVLAFIAGVVSLIVGSWWDAFSCFLWSYIGYTCFSLHSKLDAAKITIAAQDTVIQAFHDFMKEFREVASKHDDKEKGEEQ